MTLSHFIVCALKHQELHDVKHRNTPPLYQARVDYYHETLTYCSPTLQQKIFLASYTTVGFSPWRVIVLQLSPWGWCVPTHCSRKGSVVHCLAIPREVNCCTLVGNCLPLKKGVLPVTSVSNRMTELEYGRCVLGFLATRGQKKSQTRKLAYRHTALSYHGLIPVNMLANNCLLKHPAAIEQHYYFIWVMFLGIWGM